MPIAYLYPTGDVSSSGCATHPADASNYWSLVDDPGSSDDGVTDVYGSVSGWDSARFSLTSFGSNREISSVLLHGRMMAMNDYPSSAYIITHSTSYIGFTYSNSSSNGQYADKEATWTLNPFTGLAWTVAEINALNVSAILKGDGEGKYYSATSQLYIKVTYTEIPNYGAALLI